MKLKDNGKIKSIFWPNEGILSVGKNGVESITVSMEFGEMGLVPWFFVKFNNDRDSQLFNGKMIEGVVLLEDF